MPRSQPGRQGFWCGGLLAPVLVFGMASPAAAADYYASPSGRDSDPGTSAKPWRTIVASLGKMAAGDTLHLEAGAAFAENLYIGKPATLTSDPANRARILPPDTTKPGILVWDTGSVTLEHLVVTGVDMATATKNGIEVDSDGAHYAGLVLRDLDVSQFRNGVAVLG